MRKSAYISALMFGLLLVGPPAAVGLQPAAAHPAASIDVGALTAESDFTVFMREDVPEDVRRAALRRLWTLIDLPPSCMELCQDAEPAAPAPVRFVSEQRAARSNEAWLIGRPTATASMRGTAD